MEQNPPGQSSCAACGTTLRASDRFCPNCGTPNPSHDPAATDQSPMASREDPVSQPPPDPEPPAPAGYAPSPPPASWAEASQIAPDQPRRGSRNTWLLLGGLALLFLIVCCCCALLVAVTASQDSTLQEELEGAILLTLTIA